LGYDKLLSDQEKAARVAQRELARQKKEAAQVAAEEAPAALTAADEKAAAKEAPAGEIVTNEDSLVLLQALEIRAKAGIPEAKQLLGQIKILLLGC
jgi:hypothetical protein